MKRVCHLTSVHRWNDTRIFYRECVSLANSGYEVHLVAPNAEEGKIEGVQVHSVKRTSSSRIKRATVVAFRVFRKGLKTKAKLYHFHDPELIWVGVLLRVLGKKVVFDIHENIRGQIKVKQWLPMRNTVAKMYGIVDWFSARLFHLVLAENSYDEIYSKLAKERTIVLNFPNLDRLEQFKIEDRRSLPNGILYIGGVTKVRGIFETIKALKILKDKKVPFHFHCIGPVEDGVMEQVNQLEEYQEVKEHITFYGLLPILEAYEHAAKCRIGTSVLHPVENYVKSYSTKIFEYMAVGLPFIISDFPLYSFVTEKELGVLIEPESPESIAHGFETLLVDTEKSHKMAQSGINEAKFTYNWRAQEAKLVSLYERIM